MTSQGGNSGPTLGEDAPWGEGRYKKSPDLAEPPKAGDFDCNNALYRYSIIWPLYFSTWSTLTFSRPCQGSQAPGPWTGNVSNGKVGVTPSHRFIKEICSVVKITLRVCVSEFIRLYAVSPSDVGPGKFGRRGPPESLTWLKSSTLAKLFFRQYLDISISRIIFIFIYKWTNVTEMIMDGAVFIFTSFVALLGAKER